MDRGDSAQFRVGPTASADAPPLCVEVERLSSMLAHDVLQASATVAVHVFAVDKTIDDHRVDPGLVSNQDVTTLSVDIPAIITALIAPICDEKTARELSRFGQIMTLAFGVGGDCETDSLVAP